MERNHEAWMLATSRFPRSICGCGEPVWWHWMDDPATPAVRKRMRSIANCSGVHGVPEIEEEYERLVAEAVVRKLEAGMQIGVDPARGAGFAGLGFNKAMVSQSRYVPGRTPVSTYQQMRQMVNRVCAGQIVFLDDVDTPLIEDPGKLDGPDGLEARLSDTLPGWDQGAIDLALDSRPDLGWGAQRSQLTAYLSPKIIKPQWRREFALTIGPLADQPLTMQASWSTKSGFSIRAAVGPWRILTSHLMDLRSIHPVLREDLRSKALLLRESRLSLPATAEALHLSVRQLKRLLFGSQRRSSAQPDFAPLVSGSPIR